MELAGYATKLPILSHDSMTSKMLLENFIKLRESTLL